jgi:hypothetical protein
MDSLNKEPMMLAGDLGTKLGSYFSIPTGIVTFSKLWLTQPDVFCWTYFSNPTAIFKGLNAELGSYKKTSRLSKYGFGRLGAAVRCGQFFLVFFTPLLSGIKILL